MIFNLPSYVGTGLPGGTAPGGVAPVGGSAPYDPTWWDRITGWTDRSGMQHQGVGNLALNTFSGLSNAWLGYQQLQLAEDSLDENRRQFNLNFDAQAKSFNNQLEDRQRARVASNPGAYQSVGEVMDRYAVRRG